nr:MAG TPA: hypothetical protein [Caudoviricetes sp.]
MITIHFLLPVTSFLSKMTTLFIPENDVVIFV